MLVGFIVIVVALACAGFVVAIVGRTVTALGIAFAFAVLAFLVAVADWRWSQPAAIALGSAAAIVSGRLAYYALSTPDQRRKIIKR